MISGMPLNIGVNQDINVLVSSYWFTDLTCPILCDIYGIFRLPDNVTHHLNPRTVIVVHTTMSYTIAFSNMPQFASSITTPIYNVESLALYTCYSRWGLVLERSLHALSNIIFKIIDLFLKFRQHMHIYIIMQYHD